MPRIARRAGAIGLAALTPTLLAGCAEGANMLDPHGVGAQDIAGLWWVIFWMAVGVFVVVEGILVFAIFRFKGRREDPAPRQVQGNTPLEVAWTILPTVVLLGVLIATYTTMKSISTTGPQATTINVIGHQWWWEFQYPNEKVVTADELHVPVGEDVTLHIMSDDVLHNFWVPELDRKVQALPGHDNIIPIKATKVGKYYGFCGEFCGTDHALMRFFVIVQSPADYQAWLAQQQQGPVQPTTAAEQAGQKAFEASGCTLCHQIGNNVPAGFPDPNVPTNPGRKIIGPNLTHVGSRGNLAGATFDNTPQNMEHWLEAPNEVKPGNLMTTFIKDGQISPQTAQQLAAYLESLK